MLLNLLKSWFDTYQDLVDNFKECKETPKNVDTCQNGEGYEYRFIIKNACGINKIPETLSLKNIQDYWII